MLYYAHLMWVNLEEMQISAIYLWGLCEKPGGSFPNSWWRMLKSASLSEYNVGVGVLGHFAANQNWALDTGDGPSKAELRQKHDPRPGLMSREGGRERLLAATCFWINVNKDKISGSYLYYVILANIHHRSSGGHMQQKVNVFLTCHKCRYAVLMRVYLFHLDWTILSLCRYLIKLTVKGQWNIIGR